MGIRFHDVLFELVRPGPPQNQLLSPLTPYLALCGEGSPITMHIGLEHRHLLDRLERLRYVTLEGPKSGGHGNLAARHIPDRLRQSGVESLGEEVARVLSLAPSLLAELSLMRESEECSLKEGDCVHLRLRLGGSELALLPFEMALAPEAHPGESSELFLQSTLPIVPTREIRRSRPVPVSWNQPEFKVLMVSAAAGARIPETQHIQALRKAVEPWVYWPEFAASESVAEHEKRRLPFVQRRVKILRDATLDDIRQACSEDRYTHVHILAHGDHREDQGEARHGIALCDPKDRATKKVASGRELAKALLAENKDGNGRSQPLIVSLATCDSGNEGSVLVRGGSLAHELHIAGVPWVFASQFPLTFRGSVRLVEDLYPRLLRGDDPRQALFETRRLLYMSADRDHDWASLIVYASLCPTLATEVDSFFERQCIWAINVALGGLDSALEKARSDDKTVKSSADSYVRKLLDSVEERLALWRKRLPVKSDELSGDDLARRAECLGMHGSTYKRLSLLWLETSRANAEGSEFREFSKKADSYLRKSYDYYRQAFEQGAFESSKHHWVATQYLSLKAVLDKGPDPHVYDEAHAFAEIALRNPDPGERAWANGTIAELEVLKLYHVKRARIAKRTIQVHCGRVIELVGFDAFHVSSTRRQFERYRDYWQNERWDEAVNEAISALS